MAGEYSRVENTLPDILDRRVYIQGCNQIVQNLHANLRRSRREVLYGAIDLHPAVYQKTLYLRNNYSELLPNLLPPK